MHRAIKAATNFPCPAEIGYSFGQAYFADQSSSPRVVDVEPIAMADPPDREASGARGQYDQLDALLRQWSLTSCP